MGERENSTLKEPTIDLDSPICGVIIKTKLIYECQLCDTQSI